MRRGILGAFFLAFGAIGSANAQDSRIAVRMLKLENRFGDLPTQWIEARNTSNGVLRGFSAACTFFSGSAPISEGGTVEAGAVQPSQSRTFTVTSPSRGIATRAECRVRESAWDGR